MLGREYQEQYGEHHYTQYDLVQQTLCSPRLSKEPYGDQDERLRNTLAESRKAKLRAPDALKPTGRWPLAELWPEFEATRKRTREFTAAASEDLRRRSAPHFRFGRLDGCQWLVLIGSHCDRHCAQSERLKTSAGFPR